MSDAGDNLSLGSSIPLPRMIDMNGARRAGRTLYIQQLDDNGTTHLSLPIDQVLQCLPFCCGGRDPFHNWF